jgi:hypothetical protein
LADIKKYLSSPAKVLINPSRWQTGYGCVFGAIISNAIFLREEVGDWATHVYIHTDGDLLVKGDLSKYVATHDCAYQRHVLTGGSAWRHRDACLKDPVFSEIRSSIDRADGPISFGRQEGAFFDRITWDSLIDIAKEFYTADVLEDVDRHWPMEEAVIPTIAEHVLKDRPRLARSVIRTKQITQLTSSDFRNAEENVVQPVDIQAIIAASHPDECVGIKWFSRELDHPARKYVAELIRNRTA